MVTLLGLLILVATVWMLHYGSRLARAPEAERNGVHRLFRSEIFGAAVTTALFAGGTIFIWGLLN